MNENNQPQGAATSENSGATVRLRAGIAKSDITTDDPGVVIADRLFAKALVLDDGAKKVVILSMEVTAIGGICDVSDEFMPALKQRLEKELGIDPDSVLVNATHTHPPGVILCDDAEQLNRTIDAVKRALQNMTEVRIGWAYGSEDSVSMNRNLQMNDGSQWTVRHANPTPPDENVTGVSDVDSRIGVIRVDRTDGTPLAVVFNFACHLLWGATFGRVTADFPGIACGIIEETLGHDCMALFLQGAAGDVIDVQFKDFYRPRDVEPHGMKLGLGVLRAWRAITPGDHGLNVISETVRLPRRQDSEQRIEAMRVEQRELLASLRFNSLNFKTFLPMYVQQLLSPEYPAAASYAYLQEEKRGDDKLAAMREITRDKIETYLRGVTVMERLARIEDDIATFERHRDINLESGEDAIDAEIVGIKIGDCVLISAPIEILSEVGMNVKEASPYEYTFMAAFSNGYMHYGPPAADYDKGGYEVTECLLAPEWQQIYEETADRIIRAL